MEDHHVDRPGVKAWQHVKLTGPNRSIDLQSHASKEAGIMRSSKPRKGAFTQQMTDDGKVPVTAAASMSVFRAPTTWWPWRGACTRPHSELGRENPQRRWYCVSRRGRVGRRQVLRTRTSPQDLLTIRRRPRRTRARDERQTPTPAGWSSPVARQAHNLKVAGSNPAPATKIKPSTQ